jgi:hypothetical protein
VTHVLAVHDVPALQEPGPVHATLQLVLPHVIFPPHEPAPVQQTSVSVALLVTPPPQLPLLVQRTVHADPPHVTPPAHELAPEHVTLHVVAFEQSIAPPHAPTPHVIEHGTPLGHTMGPLQPPLFEQSNVHVLAMHVPGDAHEVEQLVLVASASGASAASAASVAVMESAVLASVAASSTRYSSAPSMVLHPSASPSANRDNALVKPTRKSQHSSRRRAATNAHHRSRPTSA